MIVPHRLTHKSSTIIFLYEMKSNSEKTDQPPVSDSLEDLDESKQTKSKGSKCHVCGQKFRFLKALQKHEARHQGFGGFRCRTCGLSFTTSEAREKHRDQIHKVLRCKICNVRFDSGMEYLHHINSLHEGRDRELSMCSECGKQFKTKGELTHHVASKCGTIRLFKCKFCLKNLMTAGSLHNHLLRHKGDRVHMCRFCAKTFLTGGQLKVHERIHTQEKAFVCEICQKGFCHRQSLITHSTLHTGIKPYLCEGCGNSFSCVGNLLKHRKTHADTCGKIPLTTHRVQHPSTKMRVQVNTPSVAKIREIEKRKKIEQVENIKNQYWPHDSNSNESEIQSDLVQGYANLNHDLEIGSLSIMKTNGLEKNSLPLECNLSVKQETWYPPTNFDKGDQNNYEFSQNSIINDQSNNDSSSIRDEPVDDWSNDDESVSSADSVDLATRKLRFELTTNVTKKRKKKVKYKRKTKEEKAKLKEFLGDRIFDKKLGLNCQYCGTHYVVPLWLMKHERKHEETMKIENDNEHFTCSCCTRIFDSKEECASHQQTEHADQLKCNECGRCFSNPDSVKAHINFNHRGIPRKKYVYICDKCGKVFKQKALLYAHEQANCNEEPQFRCDVCQKTFTNKYIQKSHMRVHLTEKSLLCKFCGKSFHWKGQLKIHERSHTGEKPFQCQYCPKSFPYRESLITHSTLHTGVKPHLCEACGSRFSCIGNLLKHRRTHAATCGIMTRVKTEVLIA